VSDEPLTVQAADDALWQEYTALATRGYGHPVDDLGVLRPYGDARVAVRGGRVIAGGLGLLVGQYFGGRLVPAACLAGGCVAPEERGDRLTVRMVAERLRPLQEQGAVLATVWTTSTAYARALGWEAPTEVLSWSVPTAELARSTRETRDGAGYEVTHGATASTAALQNKLAAQWNGTWRRPGWWESWQQSAHPTQATYSFAIPGRAPDGVLSLVVENHPANGRTVVVHDFWAANDQVVATMLGFLARHGSRIPTVTFQRTGLPPAPLLLHTLRRAGAASARAWHPWMLRVLDPGRAVRLRGWPTDLDLTLPIDVTDQCGQPAERFTLRIHAGDGELEPSTRHGDIRLTRGQFAVWYAGGYRSAAAAGLAGVRGAPTALTQLVHATSGQVPWLSEYF
jgi:predicted acetyltransferase